MGHQQIVIQANAITKSYKLYERSIDRLKEVFSPLRSKYHRDFYALKNVSFEIHKGQIVGIVGKNGSGKSTLLKVLTGVLTPSSGSLEVRGKVAALLELGAGFNPELTGRENIFFNGALMGFTEEEMNEKVPDILSFADIGEFIDQPVKSYSSGMFARLAFSVAINVEPDILIVDEALSVGDIFFQAKCFEKFAKFKESGRTIIFVSHDIHQLSLICDSAILLNEGELIASGSVDVVLAEYRKASAKNAAQVSLSESSSGTGESYGTHEALIEGVQFLDQKGEAVSSFEAGGEYTLSADIVSKQNLDSVIFGFSLRAPSGLEVLGTNSLLESGQLLKMEVGQRRTLRFTFVVNVNPMKLLLSVGLVKSFQGELEVIHRIYNAREVSVLGQVRGTGMSHLSCSYGIEER